MDREYATDGEVFAMVGRMMSRQWPVPKKTLDKINALLDQIEDGNYPERSTVRQQGIWIAGRLTRTSS